MARQPTPQALRHPATMTAADLPRRHSNWPRDGWTRARGPSQRQLCPLRQPGVRKTMANPHHHRHIGFPGGREQKRRRTKMRRHTTSTRIWREGLRQGRKSGHSIGQGTESAELHKSRGRVRRRAVVAKRRCGTDRRRWTSSRSFWHRTRQTRGWLRAAAGARCAGDVSSQFH